MTKKNRYFLVSFLSIAILGLSYAAIHANTVDSPLANLVSDHDAEQLVGGEFCVKLRRGRCSAYYASPDGRWFRQVCPHAQNANIVTGINCGNRYFTGVTSCGGYIPDHCRRDGANYAFGGRCIKITTVPGCVGSANPVRVHRAPSCPHPTTNG